MSSNNLIVRSLLESMVSAVDAIDISYSMSEEGLEERLLLGWHTQNAPLDLVQGLAKDWGVPSAMRGRWREHTELADGVGITVNKSFSSFRLYTHHWKSVDPHSYGEVVYRGFKCLPDNTYRVDEYVYMGDLRHPKNLSYALQACTHPERIHKLIGVCPEKVPMMFTQIKNSGRHSWLATVRHAKQDAGNVIAPQYSGHKLLHLAGGIDASKGAFDSYYLSANSKNAIHFLGD